MLIAPTIGKQASGSKAVAAIGIASVAHQIAIQAAMAAVAQPAGGRPFGGSLSNITTATNGPINNPTLWCRDRSFPSAVALKYFPHAF